MEPLALQDYICSLDPAALPRVLRVCSGVYFQGSVYEMSGRECCLSTGDLMKITGLRLLSVVCEDQETGRATDLPLNFTGHFQLSGATLPDQPLVPSAMHQGREGKEPWGCTLHQVLRSEALRGQALCCATLPGRALHLCPVYEVQAVMHMRKEVVKIPSTLEVDVEDVTEESQHIYFIKPQMLSEVLGMDGAFPKQAEILEGPEHLPIFENDWIPRLYKGQKILIHGRSCAWRVLASSCKGRRSSRHFLLSSTYQGKFRRRPREFPTVFDLTASLGTSQALRVVVTKDWESTEEELPSLSVGDRLEVLHLAKTQVCRQAECKTIDVLICSRSSGEDEECEQVMLPLHLEGGFVEEVSDCRRYSLPEIVEQLPLPCEVKVATKDSSLASDILSSFSALRLEAQITEPFLVISLCEEPSVSFQIPPRWLDMALFFTGEPVPSQTPSTDRSKVEELTEAFYYHLLKLMPSDAAPPPRPPKRRDSRDKAGPQLPRGKESVEKPKPLLPLASSTALPKESGLLPLKPTSVQSPPVVRSTPNAYAPHRPGVQQTPKPFPRARDVKSSDDSDHDYELVDEDLTQTIHKMKGAVLHY